MAISLSYLDDLSRVRISLGSVSGDVVRIERSINESHWETVRGGESLQVVSGDSFLDDFEFTDERQNFYRVLSVNPPAGLRLTGEPEHYAETQNTSSFSISGDIVVSAEATHKNWSPSSEQTFISKYEDSVNARAWRLALLPGGRLRFRWSEDGSSFESADTTVPVPTTSGRLAVRAWLDVDTGDNSHRVFFYTANTFDGPWSLLDSFEFDGTTQIDINSANVLVGARDEGTTARFVGTIHSVQVYDGSVLGGNLETGGQVVANPVFDDEQPGVVNFTGSLGLLWNIHDAEIVGGVLENSSITPSLNGQIWLKSVRFPFLNRSVRLLDRGQGIERESRSEVHNVQGKSLPVAVQDVLGGKAFTHFIQTEGPNHLDEARIIDLTLVSGKEFLIHIPSGNRAPGGFVIIDGVTQEPLFYGSDSAPRVFEVKCRAIEPPSAQVAGKLMNWRTVLRLYGGWTALINDNPEWIQAIDSVGSLDDLVVV